MWTENTYGAVRVNTMDDSLDKLIQPLTFYQKAWIMLVCACTIAILLQNRKDISLEVLFLITIFIGGFAFHIIWEGKSRYIVPYIIALIPVISIGIKFNLDTLLKKL